LQNKIGKVSFYLLHYSVLLQYKVNMGRRQTTKSKKMSSKARSARAKFTLQKALEEDEECPQERMIISSQGVQNLIELVQNHSNSCKNSELKLMGCFPTNLKLKCGTCKKHLFIRKDPGVHHLSIPEAIAAGALAAGIGHTAIKTLFSSLEMPMLGKSTYQNAEKSVGRKLEECFVTFWFTINRKSLKTALGFLKQSAGPHTQMNCGVELKRSCPTFTIMRWLLR
jgi:hypothetical protein